MLKPVKVRVALFHLLLPLEQEVPEPERPGVQANQPQEQGHQANQLHEQDHQIKQLLSHHQ